MHAATYTAVLRDYGEQRRIRPSGATSARERERERKGAKKEEEKRGQNSPRASRYVLLLSSFLSSISPEGWMGGYG